MPSPLSGRATGRKLSPAHLEHEATHAEDHAEQVHVVWCWVVQGWVTLARRGLVPAAGSGVLKLCPQDGQVLPWASNPQREAHSHC